MTGATPMFFYYLWGPRESDSSGSWHEEIRFSLKSVFMVDVRFELTTNDPWSCRRRHLWKALVRWATGKRLTNRLPKLSLTTCMHPRGLYCRLVYYTVVRPSVPARIEKHFVQAISSRCLGEEWGGKCQHDSPLNKCCEKVRWNLR